MPKWPRDMQQWQYGAAIHTTNGENRVNTLAETDCLPENFDPKISVDIGPCTAISLRAFFTPAATNDLKLSIIGWMLNDNDATLTPGGVGRLVASLQYAGAATNWATTVTPLPENHAKTWEWHLPAGTVLREALPTEILDMSAGTIVTDTGWGQSEYLFPTLGYQILTFLWDDTGATTQPTGAGVIWRPLSTEGL